jgi:predicted transcriptional regulator
MPGRSPASVNVYEIMTKPIITEPADMGTRFVARLIYMADIRRASVEKGRELIGMISLTSLINHERIF